MSTGYEWATQTFDVTTPTSAYSSYRGSQLQRFEPPPGKKIVSFSTKNTPVLAGGAFGSLTGSELVEEGDAVVGYAYAYSGSPDATPPTNQGATVTVTVTLICIDA